VPPDVKVMVSVSSILFLPFTIQVLLVYPDVLSAKIIFVPDLK